MIAERSDIFPTVYSLLQKCQLTSAFVERSFSVLRKLLTMTETFELKK